MASNLGTQTVTIKYGDPVDSSVMNRIAGGVRKVGIYSGGYLTRVNDTTVTVSTFDCEISDGTYQVRCTTASTVNVTVSSTNIYVVLRWVYTGSSSVDYVGFVATSSPATNDVVIGKCSYSGSVLTGFSYTNRTNPNIMDLFLKVEQTSPVSMYLRVRAGRVSYGVSNFTIDDQLTPLFTAPGSGSYVYLVQVDTTGTVILSTPSVYPAIPNYGGLVTLAEVTIASGTTSLSTSNIKDVRSFVGGVKVMGAALSRSTGANYQAATDGVLSASITYSLSATSGTLYVDSSASPTTEIMKFTTRDAYDYANFSYPVKRGDYYRIDTPPGSNNSYVWFTPWS